MNEQKSDMPNEIAAWRFTPNKVDEWLHGGWSEDHDHKTQRYIRDDLAYTAADLEAVARAVLEAAANLAGNFTQAQHVAHDISTGVFPGQSPNREAMAGCIRALDLTTIIARATGGKSDD